MPNDKPLDELLRCMETSGVGFSMEYDPTERSWDARVCSWYGMDKDVEPRSASGNSSLAALQALIIKAKLPIVLHKQPEN